MNTGKHPGLNRRLASLLSMYERELLTRRQVALEFCVALIEFEDAAEFVGCYENFAKQPTWFSVALLEKLHEMREMDFFQRWTGQGESRSSEEISSDALVLQGFMVDNFEVMSEHLEARINANDD